MTKKKIVWLSKKEYDMLKNHAGELSEIIGRKISVSELYNVALEFGLNNMETIKKCLAEAKQKKKVEAIVV